MHVSIINFDHTELILRNMNETCLNRKYKDYVYGGCKYRSTWKNKEYLRSKDKAKKLYDVSRHI